uniref:Uncharacterized protein n=1 Tax=Zosterops lateralis melanops TaxID=1220523 RepID=A0A8D2Q133_ZOSLA
AGGSACLAALPGKAVPGRAPLAGMGAFTRSAFVAKKESNAQPNWLGVGLAFGTSAAFDMNHDEDVTEYERRRQAKGHHKCTECS